MGAVVVVAAQSSSLAVMSAQRVMAVEMGAMAALAVVAAPAPCMG
jgi:hypothetical protein